MNTDNKKEQNPNFEVDFIDVQADENGKVKNGIASNKEPVQDTTNDVVFIPAFELDEKNMDPALLQALKSRAKARKTDASVKRNGIENKSHDIR